jgi:hypothetical protein
MIDSVQQISQRIRGPFHSHFESRDAGSRHFGNFFVRQLFDVLEEERFPLVRRQHAECSFYMSAKITIGGFFGARRDRSFDLACRREESLLATFSASGEGSTFIDNNLIQPSTKTIAITAAPQVAKRPHERGLENVIRIDTRAEHTYGVSNAGILVSSHQQREGINVPCYHCGDQVGVR